MAEDALVRIPGVLVRGHHVASRRSEHYPQGTIEMQAPFFNERGLDLSGYFSGTLNITIAPRKFRIRNARIHFPAVQWTSKHPPEHFSFSPCTLIVKDAKYQALVYYPHPETKARHHQNESVIEVLAPWIEGIRYGDQLEVELPIAEVEVT
jgi:hypothetical protein